MVKVNEQEIKDFEWDKWNIDKNWKKHQITNKESEEIFLDENNIIYEDEKHSEKEKRYLCLGKTFSAKYLITSFTIRKGKIRIISARSMSKKERKYYEEKT